MKLETSMIIIVFMSLASLVAANTQTETLKALHFKAKREMAAKKLQVQSTNTLRNFKPSFIQKDVECDFMTEETCYDENFNAVSCALYSEGGCPCPEGQVKCGGIPGVWADYYCIDLCCGNDQETCYDENGNTKSCARLAEGGCPCPEGQVKCGADELFSGYCTPLCCANDEETCYDASSNPTTCASIADGGCPCPEGQVKCGTFPEWNIPGSCMDICCADDEEICFDEAGNQSCATYADGGCPCLGGQVKCGALPELNVTGYCTDICCKDDEETCYDAIGSNAECIPIADGGCPCPEGEEKCGADASMGWAGYCTTLCCAADEETCNDDMYNPVSCAAIAEGGCLCPEGEVKCFGYHFCATLCCEQQTCYYPPTWEPAACVGWEETCPYDEIYDSHKAEAITLMDQSGMTKELTALREIKMKEKSLLIENDIAHNNGIKEMIKAEEAAIFRRANRNKSKEFKKFDRIVPAFMLEVY